MAFIYLYVPVYIMYVYTKNVYIRHNMNLWNHSVSTRTHGLKWNVTYYFYIQIWSDLIRSGIIKCKIQCTCIKWIGSTVRGRKKEKALCKLF